MGVITTIRTYFTIIRQALYQLIFGSKIKNLAGIPGPTPTFPLGNLDVILAAEAPWFAHRDLVNKYGNMVLIWAFGSPTIWINGPELINQATNTPEDFFKREPCSAIGGICSPHDPFSTNGADWEKRHNNFALANPKVIKEWVPQQVPLVLQVTRKHLQDYIDRSKVEDLSLIQSIIRIVHDTFMHSSMGQYPNDQAFKDWQYLGSVGDLRIKVKPIGALPPLNPWVNVTKKRLWSYYDSLIAQALASPSKEGPPCLAVYIRQNNLRDFDLLGSELPDQLYGGAFSVSTTITSALFFLSQNPNVLEKLRKELRDLKDFSHDSLTAAGYLDSVIRESQRVFPPVPTNLRCTSTEKSVELGGRTIPPGTSIIFSCFTPHTDAEVYPEPEKFSPERWEKPGFKKEHDYHSSSFFPFGHGFRYCKPAHWALVICKSVIAEIVTTSDWTTNNELKHELYFGTNHPKTTTVRFESLKKKE